MKQYIENPGPNVMFAGGKMIPPGEGREIEVPDIQTAPLETGPDPDAPLLEFLAGNVKAITEQLPGFSDAVLLRLTELESASETARKTLLSELRQEQMRRADDALQRAAALQALAHAQAALDAETDPEKRGDLETALTMAHAEVDALGPDPAA